FMKRCDLYVQPSRYEGKAVTVSEAQILGKPVLITNYPTASSQVKDGVDGIITDLSPEGLADKIEALYKDRDILKRLENHCSKTDFSNEKELERLYELF
ncbi:MAG: glycosyltransferase, partial [Cetobacterium sp.]